jgi:hypothetical protein
MEQVAFRTEEGHAGGDQLLADRVDRRVGHLREQLPEITVEQLRAVESTAIGASLPIEPSGWLPVSAEGPRMKRLSSKV